MVTISMARNDIRHGLFLANEASKARKPELAYWVRSSTGHLFEAVDAVQKWRSVPEVRRFISAIPKAVRDELRAAEGGVAKLGHGALAHSRNRTFHYPNPGG